MRFDSLKSLRVLFALAAVFALVAAAACTTETVKEVPVEVVVEKEVVKEVMVPAAGPGAAEIAAIVEKAVQAAVPKGTSPEEISRLVEAAVAGATADVPTKGELEASIAKSVKDAAAAQLTAADVEKIVDASVSAVVEEVAEAAAMAAGKAVELSIVKLPEGVREERAGFQRVNVPEVERPTNIKADLTLEPVQELSYVYNSAAQGGILPPYKQGANDASLYFWVFQTAFLLGRADQTFPLRQGWATGYSVSDDGRTYLLHINPDAIYQDGTPITAASVKLAWEFAAWPENQPGWRSSMQHAGFVEGMEAVEAGDAREASGITAIDDHTVEFKLTAFLPTFPLRLAAWPMGLFKAEHAINDPEGFRLNPIGVGPYRGSYDDATGKQTYTATKNWWGAPPFIKVIHRPAVQDLQTSYIMYENEELDILYADPPRQPAIWDPANPFHGDLKDNGGSWLWHVEFQTDHPPFDDINVRKAFAIGADMDSVVPAILGPLARPARGLNTFGNACWKDTGHNYDPEAARAALKASRYGGPEGVPPITIELSRPNIIRVFEVLQEQWKDNLGIQINLVALEPGQQRQDVVGMRRTGAGGQLPDPSGVLVNLGEKLDDPAIDASIASALELPLDDPGYCGRWQKLEAELRDTYYFLPLFTSDTKAWAVHPWVQGYVTGFLDAFLTLPYWQIGTRDRSLY